MIIKIKCNQDGFAHNESCLPDIKKQNIDSKQHAKLESLYNKLQFSMQIILMGCYFEPNTKCFIKIFFEEKRQRDIFHQVVYSPNGCGG